MGRPGLAGQPVGFAVQGRAVTAFYVIEKGPVTTRMDGGRLVVSLLPKIHPTCPTQSYPNSRYPASVAEMWPMAAHCPSRSGPSVSCLATTPTSTLFP